MRYAVASLVNFSSLGVSAPILAVLDRLHFKTPTPIQHQSIPAGLLGKDIIGIAQTGTGKTLAFGIPMIQRLQAMPGSGLILLPTRELAQQVDEALHKIGKGLGMTAAVVIGGESMYRQIDALQRRPRIVIATPGRLLDHLQQGTARMDDVRVLVLDEADRMLDMGFAPQINQILKRLPRDRQTLLYSATMPGAIVNIATAHMKLPVRVEVAPAGTAAENVEQEIIIVGRESKQALLESVLHEHAGTALVFSRTKHGAKKICRNLNIRGFHAAEIHANRSQSQRRQAMEGFRNGRYRVLVATDIAARGIDVSHIETVVNYDLPDNSEDYVHRIGRTGRAGREGRAISFATPDQKRDIRDIEKLIRKTLKVTSRHGLATTQSPGPSTRPVPFERPADPQPRRSFGFRTSGRSRRRQRGY
ncbi:MAG: DEAD/DEAH box helicase [Deltaproteobacteria bacterium]|nr:DEAD/DEAH box helicase [Deltaproteobacteria bacterium]